MSTALFCHGVQGDCSFTAHYSRGIEQGVDVYVQDALSRHTLCVCIAAGLLCVCVCVCRWTEKGKEGMKVSVCVDVHYSMERICFKSSAAVEATSKQMELYSQNTQTAAQLLH